MILSEKGGALHSHVHRNIVHPRQPGQKVTGVKKVKFCVLDPLNQISNEGTWTLFNKLPR